MKASLKPFALIMIIVILLTSAACKSEAPGGGEAPANSQPEQTEAEAETVPPSAPKDESTPESSVPPPADSPPPTESSLLAELPPAIEILTPEPTAADVPESIPATSAPEFLTDDQARAICRDWLDNHFNLHSYTLVEWADGLYPSYVFFGEPYYSFGVNGISGNWFSILVHIETGETLFMTKTFDEYSITAVGLLSDWDDWEYAEYTPVISVDEARSIYDSWLNGVADTLSRQSNETYELFGERYYLFRDERDLRYWYNILVHMDTGELFLLLSSDGQFPVTIIKPLTDDWDWGGDSSDDWWDAWMLHADE